MWLRRRVLNRWYRATFRGFQTASFEVSRNKYTYLLILDTNHLTPTLVEVQSWYYAFFPTFFEPSLFRCVEKIILDNISKKNDSKKLLSSGFQFGRQCTFSVFCPFPSWTIWWVTIEWGLECSHEKFHARNGAAGWIHVSGKMASYSIVCLFLSHCQ